MLKVSWQNRIVTCLVIYYFQIKLVIPMRNQHQISPYINLVNSHLSLHTQLTFNKRGFYNHPNRPSLIGCYSCVKCMISYVWCHPGSGVQVLFLITSFSHCITCICYDWPDDSGFTAVLRILNTVFSILATSLLIKEITSYGQGANYIYTVFSATVTLNMVQEICKRKTIMLYNLILKPDYETHLIATVA